MPIRADRTAPEKEGKVHRFGAIGVNDGMDLLAVLLVPPLSNVVGVILEWSTPEVA